MTLKIDEEHTLREVIIARFKWLDRLAVFALTFFCTVVLAKIFGAQHVGIFGAKIPLDASIAVLLILTFAHVLTAKLIISSLHAGWLHICDGDRKRVYNEVLGKGGILVRGAFSYQDALFKKPESEDVIYVYLATRSDDPPVILQTMLYFVAIFACVPFDMSFRTLAFFIASVSLTSANWQIGANWAIALVDFGQNKGKNFYFSDTYGPRTISTISGFWLNEQSSWTNFVTRKVFEFLKIMLIVSAIYAVIYSSSNGTSWILGW